MADIEAALERLERGPRDAARLATGIYEGQFEALRNLYAEQAQALSTIRQALREREDKAAQFRQDFMEVSVQLSGAEDRIEKLEAALTLITQDIRFLAAAPVARQALSTPSEVDHG